MLSLTSRESAIRASSIRVGSYEVELDFTRGDTDFWSRSTIEFDSLDRQATWIDIQPSELISVRLNGRQVDIGMSDGTSVIPAVSQGIPVRYIATVYGQFPSIVFAKAS